MQNKYCLEIANMNCAGCISRIEQILLQLKDVKKVECQLVEKLAWIEGGQLAHAIKALSEQGYQVRYREQLETKSWQIHISNMNCAGCVANIEKALLPLEQVTQAQCQLVDKTVLVRGGEIDQILQHLADKGYPGSLIANADDALYRMRFEQFSDETLKELLAQCLINNQEKIAPDIYQFQSPLSPCELLEQLKKNGVDAEFVSQKSIRQDEKTHQYKHQSRKLLTQAGIALSSGISLLLAMKLEWFPALQNDSQSLWLGLATLCLMVMGYCGNSYYVGAFRQAKFFHFSMDALVSLGTLAAWSASMINILSIGGGLQGGYLYLDASVFILGFLQLGKWIELRAKQTTRHSLDNLLALSPQYAQVLWHNTSYPIPLELLQEGDVVRVRPSERIAVDGVIIAGESKVDESMFSGESKPVKKQITSSVYAGSLNLQGSFDFIVKQRAHQTVLANMIKMIQTAQSGKPEIAKLVDKIAAIFVPIVMLISLITFSCWLLFDPQSSMQHALTAAISVLVIACPCALGLATPIAVMMGVAKAAQHHILIQNGESLQGLSQITHVLFDKTGTLTEGKASLQSVWIAAEVSEKYQASQIIQLAASVEQYSQHPLAQAFHQLVPENDFSLLAVTDFQNIPSLGVCAKYQDGQIYLGNQQLMQQNNIDISSYSSAKDLNASEVYLAYQGQFLAVLVVGDAIRSGAKSCVEYLQSCNIQLMICSGDKQAPTAQIAKQLSIQHIFAEQSHQDKLALIQKLQQQGGKVAMIGDGINDGAALARADVSISFAKASDVAIAQADMVLTGKSLFDLVTMFELSHASMLNIKQNLLAASIYNLVGIPLAAGLFYPFTGWLLAPAFASAAMAMSSISVVVNANRLRFFRPKTAFSRITGR